MSGPGGGEGGADPVASTARAVRDAALATVGVARLSGGPLGEVATYLPGDRVAGVRLAPDGVHVHVVLTQSAAVALPGAAAAVRAAVLAVPAVGDGPVHVHVEDVDTSGLPPGGSQVPLDGTRKDER